MKNNIKHWYNKLPEIGYQMKPYVKGGKTFLPNRGKGNYKAALYSGRGVKFNGTDQSVATDIYSIAGDTTISFSFIPNTASGQLCILGRSRIMLHLNKIQMDLRDSGGSPDIYVSSILDTTKMYNVSIVFYVDKIGTWLNGVLNTVTITPTIGLSYQYIGQRGIDASFSDSTISNMMILNQALEPYEIQYQHTNPEKFLYHEKQADGTFVAKSTILSQEKIDSIVAHFPMCETDMFVRDMIKYSETQVSGTIATGATNDDEVSTYTKNDDTSYDLAVTTAGTNTARPYLAHNFVVISSAFHYRVSFDVVVNSGASILTRLYNGKYIKINETLKTGHYEYVMPVGDDSYQYFVQYFDGTELFDISITNFRVDELTATYPIENYTESCNATILPTGLQTCFWKRDKLGVPIDSSFKEISFDGGGYADTMWTPDLSTYLCTELVLVDNGESIQFFGCKDTATARFAFGLINGLVRIYLGDKYPVFSAPDPVTHVVLVVTGAIGESRVFINGVDAGTIDETAMDTPESSFRLGRFGTAVPSPSCVRLFNVHTEPQDPVKLYADAVKKGLLS